MKKNICFITGFFPVTIYNEIITNSKFNVQNAADKLQKSFIEGLLSYYPKMYVINVPFVGSFPKRYKKLKIPSTYFNEIDGESLGYINLTGLKYEIIKSKLIKTTRNWINTVSGDKIIIVYSLQSYLVKVLSVLKNDFSDLKIIIIIPDLIQFMGHPASILHRIKRKLDINFIYSNLHIVDAYLLLSKFMLEKLPQIKPYRVIEGISTSSSTLQNIEKINIKTVFYSGSLAYKYGIMNLIKAFQISNLERTQLLICGSGECEKEINMICENDPNIKYLGLLMHKDVLELQRKAHLLVNPRTPEGEFTKYSFPSKTMEYFQSGTPVLLYKLQGIPEEYYEYCFAIEDDFSIENLSKNLMKILIMDQLELNNIGLRAKEFIELKKNSFTQCAKIVELIDNL